MSLRFAVSLFVALTACAPSLAPAPDLPTSVTIIPGFTAQSHSRGVARSNATVAADFLDLVFQLESGQPVPILLRYETPVRVYLRTATLRRRSADLEYLLARIRSEAGIDIASVDDETQANLFIEAVPPGGLQRAVPGAACFLAPAVRSWAEYTGLSRVNRPKWSRQGAINYNSIFIPTGISPQEVRDCFHEEIAQSLGPVNDLYRLPDSVFNDDNMHSILTPFDMTILRALYSPNLTTGMGRPQVAALIPAILAQANPAGSGMAPQPRGQEPDGWKSAIEGALTRDSNDRARQTQGARAVSIARNILPNDHRLALSELALGRLLLKETPEQAAKLFFEAYQVSLTVGDPVRSAHAGLHVSVIALSLGQFDVALDIADRHLADSRRAENATLVSGFQAVRAEALLRLGRAAEAKSARAESLHWAEYAFGSSPKAIAEAQRQIAGLAGNTESAR